MGKFFIHDDIPLNLVRSQLFRDFCKLSISSVFSCLLDKSAIYILSTLLKMSPLFCVCVTRI